MGLDLFHPNPLRAQLNLMPVRTGRAPHRPCVCCMRPDHKINRADSANCLQRPRATLGLPQRLPPMPLSQTHRPPSASTLGACAAAGIGIRSAQYAGALRRFRETCRSS
jgi:hypothetical protein